MTKYNYELLKARIIEKFGTHYAFAQAMGISICTLSRFFNHKNMMNQEQIEKMCDLLDIPLELISLYFLNHS